MTLTLILTNMTIGFILGILATGLYQLITPENEEKQIKKYIKKMKKATLHEKQELKRMAKHFIDRI